MTIEEVKVLIVEDEILIAEDIKDSLQKFGVRKIMMAHNKSAALLSLKVFEPQIVLLDIRMEGRVDGLEIAEHIKRHYKANFIFITAHSDLEMVKEILKTNPSGYITKPFKKSDLFAHINLALGQLQNIEEKKIIKVKDGHQVLLIEESEINYIESQGNYVMIFYDDSKVLCRQSLESFQLEVDAKKFFRIGKSCIVNCSKVKSYTRNEVTLGDKVFPLSRKVVDEFMVFMKSL